MNAVRNAAAPVGMLMAVMATTAVAQVPRTGVNPRLPPAPAPALSSVNQTPGTIFPQIWFQVAQGVVSILVSRTPQGGTPIAVTPAPVPLSQVPTPTGQYYYWTDNTLNALGMYTYQVAAVYGDGRTGISTPIAYSPVITEPSGLAVTKPNPFTAVIAFQPSKSQAQAYRLFGTGLPTYGVQATNAGGATSAQGWTVTVGNLAAGTYNWILRAEYAPGVRTNGVPVAVTLP